MPLICSGLQAFLVTLAVHVAAATPGCAHDTASRTSGGVRNLGYSFNRAVPYSAETTEDGGRRLTSASTFQPIRITIDYSAAATSAAGANENWLQQTLVPSALAWIQSSLSVVPVSGALRHSRTCASTFSSGTCATEGATTCGLTSSGSDYTVPAAYLDSLQVCSTCYVRCHRIPERVTHREPAAASS
jgi:hypothetical protein